MYVKMLKICLNYFYYINVACLVYIDSWENTLN